MVLASLGLPEDAERHLAERAEPLRTTFAEVTAG